MFIIAKCETLSNWVSGGQGFICGVEKLAPKLLGSFPNSDGSFMLLGRSVFLLLRLDRTSLSLIEAKFLSTGLNKDNEFLLLAILGMFRWL